MKVIILAGGRGTRLPDSAKDIPKVLVEVNGKKILDHQVEALENAGFSDIRFALGFRADNVIEHLNGRYEHVVEEEPLGTGGAIKFASSDLKEPFMVLNGDVIGNVNIKDFHAHWDTMRADNTQGAIVVAEVGDARDFGLMKLEGNHVVRFSEKPKDFRPGFINAGIYIFSPSVFDRDLGKSFSLENDVFPRLADDRMLLYFLHKGTWTDLGTEDRLKKARDAGNDN